MDTRSRIIEAARDLFWEKGYNSTSVADILSRSQVNSGSLYHFFPSKQDVLIGVLTAYRDGIEAWLLSRAWGGVDDPIEKIFALLNHYRWRLLETECLYGCPIGSLALELHEPDPPVRELLAANFDGWTEAVKKCLDAAKGRLPKGADTHALSQFILTVMEGGVMQARTHRNLRAYDASVAGLRDYLKLLEGGAR
jgi:TetR/AcrR family transcriptional regulator, transcriptional repressor for nem operon